MDRISAIRNIEDAIHEFEDGEADLAETERKVATVLRTYATEFDGEDAVFRAVGDEPFDGTVVVAPSEPAARERVVERAESEGSAEATSNTTADATFEIERL
ncbi:MAG: hypothetical protein ABEH81_10930 [Halopenitus sp.]